MAENRDKDERIPAKRAGVPGTKDDAAVRNDRELDDELRGDRGPLRGGAEDEDVPGSGRDVDPNREP